MKRSGLVLGTVAAAIAYSGSSSAQLRSAENITVSVNPKRVCVTRRAGSYPNLDLIIDNPTAKERQIEEIRGLVYDSSGAMIERRLLWQQGLNLLGESRVLASSKRTLIFNPFSFTSELVGRTLTYEVLLAGQQKPVSVSTTPHACANRYALSLPVSGRILVYDGFDYLSHHRRGQYDDDWSRGMGITDNFQRFGLDFVMIDAAGHFFTGDGSRTDQWIGWGRPVRAPGEGIVAGVHDGQPDNVVIGTVDKWTDRPSRTNPMSSYGNYVLIKHGAGEFSLVGHLRNGSVKVKTGDAVRPGQIIGEIGNSGASGGVHVHFERRTGPGLAGIDTLPAYFGGLNVAGDPTGSLPIALDSGDVVLAH